MQIQRLRGGQRKHWAEQVRLWIWYGAVKERCDWSPHRLDAEFAWQDQELRVSNPDLRPRTFENIQKFARAPRRKAAYRSMEQLVVAVDDHPLFRGTRGIYDSKIWWLFSETCIDIEQIKAEVASILERYDLAYIRSPYPPGLENLILRESLTVVSDRCMRLSIEDLPDYIQIELVWYFYVMAQPAHSRGFRAAMEGLLDNLLDDFFRRRLPKSEFTYYQLACDAMVEARFTSAGSPTSAHAKAEAFYKGLLVPKLYAYYLSHPETSMQSVGESLGLY